MHGPPQCSAFLGQTSFGNADNYSIHKTNTLSELPFSQRYLGATPNRKTLGFRKKRSSVGFSSSASYSKRGGVPYAGLVHFMVCTSRNPRVSFSKGSS
jgi:hypothetical protein